MQRTKIDGFYLTVIPQYSSLTLEIEEESSGKVFSADVTNEKISQMTDDLYDPHAFIQGLENAAKNYPGFELTLVPGKLIFRIIIIEETLSFHFNLKEREPDQVGTITEEIKRTGRQHYEANTVQHVSSRAKIHRGSLRTTNDSSTVSYGGTTQVSLMESSHRHCFWGFLCPPNKDVKHSKTLERKMKENVLL